MNNAQIMFSCKFRHPVVITKNAVIIHDNDCLGLGCDHLCGAIQIDAQRIIQCITKNQLCPGLFDGLKIRRAIERRCYDLVARPHTGHQQSHMQGRSTGAYRSDMTIRILDKLLDRFLKLVDIATHSKPAKIESALHRIIFFLFQ